MKTVTEDVFQAQVISMARLLGWRVAHFRTGRVQRGDGSVHYITPVQADGEGFPDLVMVRGGRVLFVELKRHGGRLSAEQSIWVEGLTAAAETYVWWPRDMDAIEEVLR